MLTTKVHRIRVIEETSWNVNIVQYHLSVFLQWPSGRAVVLRKAALTDQCDWNNCVLTMMMDTSIYRNNARAILSLSHTDKHRQREGGRHNQNLGTWPMALASVRSAIATVLQQLWRTSFRKVDKRSMKHMYYLIRTACETNYDLKGLG